MLKHGPVGGFQGIRTKLASLNYLKGTDLCRLELGFGLIRNEDEVSFDKFTISFLKGRPTNSSSANSLCKQPFCSNSSCVLQNLVS